jgi:2-amino-4-hydroxy-6-hydroxymethyldihydropteridine diphosphokinase
MRYRAYIGLGSNLASAAGDPAETVRAAVRAMAGLGKVVAQSSLYRTAPVGYREQPYFINAVVCLETEFEPEGLLRELLAVERSFGRERQASVPKGPRKLDLDLLLAEDGGEAAPYESPTLTLPHPEMAKRRFVLEPLAEIAPELRHPLLHRTVRELLAGLKATGTNTDEEVTRLEGSRDAQA